MKVDELIEKLREYPLSAEVMVINVSDDTGESDEVLHESSIDYVDLHNRDENPAGKGVIICYGATNADI